MVILGRIDDGKALPSSIRTLACCVRGRSGQELTMNLRWSLMMDLRWSFTVYLV